MFISNAANIEFTEITNVYNLVFRWYFLEVFSITVFHNSKLICNDFLTSVIHVNQGFTKCSICPISSNAAITTDYAIAKTMSGQGIDVLQIKPDGIVLQGYNYGFIGGCAFMIAGDKLAFTGQLNNIENRDEILAFLKKHSVEPIYLTDLPLFDIGGAIPIIERD